MLVSCNSCGRAVQSCDAWITERGLCCKPCVLALGMLAETEELRLTVLRAVWKDNRKDTKQ